MDKEFYNQPLPSYGQYSPYQLPVSEDQHFKKEYTKINIENKAFNYLKKRLTNLSIPEEKISDLIDELDILVNNAGKMKLDRAEIGWLLDEFDKLWDNYCIYSMKNHRWINELEHVRIFAEYILLQEYHKSIEGWQGDNILRTKIEQSQSYNVRQENIEPKRKRGWFKNPNSKRVQNSPALQGYNISQSGGQ